MAADYFHIAFFNQSTIHFPENSFVKKTFMVLNKSIYESVMIVFSWIYVLLCIIEPGNRASWPYEETDEVFKFIIAIESII